MENVTLAQSKRAKFLSYLKKNCCLLYTSYRMVKDYTIRYKAEDGSTQILCEVRDNIQRVNELCFDAIYTDEITISLQDTHGQPFYSLYEIRCY